MAGARLNTSLPLRQLRRKEYEHLFVAAGLLDGEAVELFRGRLIQMPAQRGPHAKAVQSLMETLVPRVAGCAGCRVQFPFIAADDSEPEPDVWIGPRSDDDAHPSNAWLIIEVADTSLAYDRNEKAPLYAESGVPHYWIVNLQDRTVEVFSNAREGRYQSLRTVDRAGELALPPPLDDIRLPVALVVRA